MVADRDKAKGIAQYRKMKEREAQLAKSSRVSLEGLAEQIRQAGVKDLALIIKGDVTGSVEVLADSLVRMSTEKVRVKVIHYRCRIDYRKRRSARYGFQRHHHRFQRAPQSARAAELAQQEGIEIRLHSIIYELQDEMRLAMLGLLDPTFKGGELPALGRAEVINVFRIPKVGTIAGCRVQDGCDSSRFRRSKSCVADEQVYKGKIGSLSNCGSRTMTREVTSGMAGAASGFLGGFSDLKEGDVIEAFSTEKPGSRSRHALTSAKPSH